MLKPYISYLQRAYKMCAIVPILLTGDKLLELFKNKIKG